MATRRSRPEHSSTTPSGNVCTAPAMSPFFARTAAASTSSGESALKATQRAIQWTASWFNETPARDFRYGTYTNAVIAPR
jgi:hypothetical protein